MTDQKLPFSLITFPSAGSRANILLEKEFGLVNSGKAIGQCFDLKNSIIESEDIGVTIRLAETDDDLEVWDSISARCFDHPVGLAKRFLFPRGAKSAPGALSFFLAFFQNKPVGGGILFRGETSIGFYWTGVLPEARGRHVYSKLVETRLHHAKQLGAKYVCVQTMPMSHSACNRLGFKEYDAFQIYAVLSPP